MNSSGYVSAGIETVTELFSRGINEGILTVENLRDAFKRLEGFLHSYGEGFGSKKDHSKFNKTKQTLLSKVQKSGLYEKTNIYLDSGGFQVSFNRIKKQDVPSLIQYYYEFLSEFPDLYTKAFILDLVPGPGCELFKTEDDIYRYNLDTYSKATQLDPEIKKKIIYIHHFRTPALNKAFSQVLEEVCPFDHFQCYATGSIVATMKTDSVLPINVYALPLVILIDKAKQKNFKQFSFHILGGAVYRDIILYELCRICCLRTHGIDLNITFDSSGIFKGLLMSRYIDLFLDPGIIQRLDLRSSQVTPRSLDLIQDQINKSCDYLGVPRPNFHVKSHLYNNETDTLYLDVTLYLALVFLANYIRVQEFCRARAKELYDLYEAGDASAFSIKLGEITSRLNRGKATSKQRIKCSAIFTSMDCLKQLDTERCNYIISKYLYHSESYSLRSSQLACF